MESVMTDREKLEYITRIAYDAGIVTASWCKDLLGFRYLDQFWTWFDNYDIDAASRRHADASIKKYYRLMEKM